MRPERRRIFGHPDLIEFLQRYGEAVALEKLGALHLGDLSQPRGGPAPTGHASHQTGLDVDIWYVLDGATSQPHTLLNPQGNAVNGGLTSGVERVLRMAVDDTRVGRVFVNPFIKAALCQKAGAQREWLHKIRPWWGHADHFHVRLACPPESPACEAQAALPPGDGCEELSWWQNPQHAEDRARQQKDYKAKVGARPPLPPRCQEILDDAAP